MKLKSYRGFILKLLFPFFVIDLLLIISMSICFAYFPEDMKGCLAIFIMLIILAVILFGSLLVINFRNGVNYEFNENSINVYNGKKFIEKIDIENIEIMNYRPFRFRYIITIFFGELMDGGAWKLHIKFKDGTKKELAYFSTKDIEKIKGIYGDLINIL